MWSAPRPTTQSRRLEERLELKEPLMSTDASEMVSIRREDLDALTAEVRRLRREIGRIEAKRRIEAALSGTAEEGITLTREQLAEAWGIRE